MPQYVKNKDFFPRWIWRYAKENKSTFQYRNFQIYVLKYPYPHRIRR
jgi:hypothetical protein